MPDGTVFCHEDGGMVHFHRRREQRFAMIG